MQIGKRGGILAMILLILLSARLALAAFARTTMTAAHREPADYLSPDGKYVARLHYDTAALKLSITPVQPHSKRSSKTKSLVSEWDIDGYLWEPGKAHTLIFAVSGVYGQAKLALWNGGKHLHLLRQAKRPDQEVFKLYGVSADGHTVFFGHGTAEQTEDQYQRRRLTLAQAKGEEVYRHKSITGIH